MFPCSEKDSVMLEELAYTALHYDYVVVGGGIAGVTCLETLAQLSAFQDDIKILLISESTLIKALVNYQQIGHTMESMDVTEQDYCTLTSRFSNVTILNSRVLRLDTDKKHIYLSACEDVYSYGKLCVATGASPKYLSDNEHVLAVRDTQSVQQFQEKLKDSERIVIVGNGGIATELVYEVQGCEIIWCVKDKSISSAFFDDSTAQFFLPHLQESSLPKEKQGKTISRRWKYTSEQCAGSSSAAAKDYSGNALGPDWAMSFNLKGASEVLKSLDKVHVEYGVEMDTLLTPHDFSMLNKTEATSSSKSWPVYIKLTNRKVYGADLVLNATGVTPSCSIEFKGETQIELAKDMGIIIDTEMRSNIPDVYAAGDVVNTSKWTDTEYWYQMRLWSQAKQMGAYAAKCMHKHTSQSSISPLSLSYTPPIDMDICFELFSHVTQFFGFKVVLLGLYNGQGLQSSEYTVHLRYTPGKEYTRVIVRDGCVVGAVLIGDTDLEETFENLILNKLCISHIEDQLLDPDIDIEDYFD
ncbi:PYROXD1 [Bugula neritina]|uniref:Pyridine nucleotide-disulfide oxidoreductase domain-containing protein 1 n=1 Tax=Bugula neritina TaxID=10212 RepID=A0A7J7JH09_BUGNE|nr:PYROXD1 [Bugula neritina]